MLAAVAYIFATPLDIVPTPFGTPSTLTGLLFLGLWLLSLISGHPRLPRRSFAVPAMVAIGLWYLLSLGWSWDAAATRVQIQTYVLLVLSAVAIGGTIQDRIVVPAWALSLGASVASVATLLSGQEIVDSQGFQTQIEQSTFLGIDQNILAFHLNLGLGATAYLLVTRRPVRRRALALIPLGVISVALLAVGSRTGAGSMMMTFGVMAVLSARSVRAIVLWVISLAVALWGYFRLLGAGLLPPRLVEWIEQPVINDNRLDIIAQYWLAREDWWLRGVGAGADASYLWATQGSYLNAHSAFWRVWIDSGLVGLALWASMLITLSVRALRSESRAFFFLSAPPIVAFFYTLGPLNSNMLWVIFGLALGASRASGHTNQGTGQGLEKASPTPSPRTSSSHKAIAKRRQSTDR